MQGAVHEVVTIAASLTEVDDIKSILKTALPSVNSKKPLIVLDWNELMPGLRQSIEMDLVSGLISADDARKIARGAGATGYKELPPGIRKNLARGKPMPPGIQKTRMPGGMIDQLPKRKGYDWQVAGTDLLLVQAGSNIVSDVLKDVFK